MKAQEEYRTRLIGLANGIGYTVELDSPMTDHIKKKHLDENGKLIKEVRPAGDCYYEKRRIRVREGKGLDGQVSTLIHELCHAMGMGGPNNYSMLGSKYLELVCESVTQFVTQMIGMDRTKKTAPRIITYGYTGYLVSPVTQALTNVFADVLGFEAPILDQESQKFKLTIKEKVKQ